MWGLIISISIFWFLIHLLHRRYQETPRPSASHSSPFNFSLTLFVAKLETERFNQLPLTLLRLIGITSNSNSNLPLSSKSRTERDRNPSKRFLLTFYEIGSWFAFGASIASICIIVAGLFQLFNDVRSLILFSSTTLPEGQQRLLKRSEVQNQNPIPTSNVYRPTITPLIPGVTLPLWHLPFMVIALLLSQVIHEAGHAIAGALNGLKPLRMGLLLVFPILPGAFVVLPDDAFEVSDSSNTGAAQIDPEVHRLPNGRGKLLKPDSQLSILAAGVWHNFVSFGLVSLLLWIGIGGFFRSLGWEEIEGMSVKSLDPYSPLASYLSIGDTITHLDDLSINAASATDRQKLWNHFLLEESFIPGSKDTDGIVTSPHWSIEQEKTEELGWCIEKQVWEGLQSHCCDQFSMTTKQTSNHSNATEVEFCFTSSGSESSQRCLDPLPLINQAKKQDSSSRCIDSCTDSSSICIRPDPREELVRLEVIDRSQSSIPKVVLFQGSRQAIHSALEVSPFRPRWWFLPSQVLEWFELTTSYFLSLSLALALLNMLPLPHLDGDAFMTIAARKWLESRKGSRTRTSEMERRRENASRGTRDVAGRFVGEGEESDEVWLMKVRRRVHWLVGIFAVTVLCGSTLLHLILGE